MGRNTNPRSSEGARDANGKQNGKLKEGFSEAGQNTQGPRAGKADLSQTPLGFVNATSQVVLQAAAILEEEIAAGIVAAREVESRLTKSSVAPSHTRDNVLQRFRKDLHEVVDSLLDVIDVAINSSEISRVSTSAVRGATKQQKKSPSESNGHVRLLTAPRSVSAGEKVELAMTVENDVVESTVEFGFVSTNLVSPSGDLIAARQVKFSPACVTLGPREDSSIKVAVTVPRGKPSGSYTGVIQTTIRGGPQAVLVIQVG